MTRGGHFYAVWDEEAGYWSQDEMAVARIIDEDLQRRADEYERLTGEAVKVRRMQDFANNQWSTYKRYISQLGDSFVALDSELTFANTHISRESYASKRLPYNLEPGSWSAWDELVGLLYSPEERQKIEWAIGAVVAGKAKHIQKFLVLYGPAGTGKSTIINILEMLFPGYTATFDAGALGDRSDSFATEVFRSNPLVAYQHDGDLSRIQDNARLNSVISHEPMVINQKFRSTYSDRVNAMLFVGSNKPVKISDARSGVIRRLIDVQPTGRKFTPDKYASLMSRIKYELGATAWHCREIFEELGPNAYDSYTPTEMIFRTNTIYNFVHTYMDELSQPYVPMSKAYILYTRYCEENGFTRRIPRFELRDELKDYYEQYHPRYYADGSQHRSVFVGLRIPGGDVELVGNAPIDLVEGPSVIDDILRDQPAQYALPSGVPSTRWDAVSSRLSDLDTSKLHYVLVPHNHIVIDFDLKDGGRKSLEKNLAAAGNFPPTYTELSKSGSGVHLHYIYEGDPESLSTIFSEGIEVKTLLGKSSLRRKLTKHNNLPISSLASGALPLKKENRMTEGRTVSSEKALRELITRVLNREFHQNTAPNIAFINTILDESYSSGLVYDVTDMKGRIMVYAASSTNQAAKCIKTVKSMRFASATSESVVNEHDEIVFFDVEVFPNLFVVCSKSRGVDSVTKLINPTPDEIEELCRFKLVGFNNRRYDNHILYARWMGYDNAALYRLSQRIISGEPNALFASAYGISYTDIYDFSSKKQGLKKFQIELGLVHNELDHPWDQPVPDELVETVVAYCANDVRTTEQVFESRIADFNARHILSDLSGLPVNDTTQKHTARIIFGDDRNPQAKFLYSDLSKEFPGYEYSGGKSTYRGEEPGEGGYVYSEPGYYENVAVLDVASMHPTSIVQLGLFGEYTPNFDALKEARLAIKHGELDRAKGLLNGKLAPYLESQESIKGLAYALKIVINIVYGLTCAKFDNPFRDIRNTDNIVAKRGALFMIDLKYAVQAEGYTVCHIKTDSIKIPDADEYILDFVREFGAKYGYTFEHETTYDKMCLVNDAVYIANCNGKWSAVGAQFQHPYIFKKLFSKEPITYSDMHETKSVSQGVIRLEREGDYSIFIGKTGVFVPVVPDAMGGTLYRCKDDKRYLVQGTKGYSWLESAKASEDLVDLRYFESLCEDAQKSISMFTNFEEFSCSTYR